MSTAKIVATKLNIDMESWRMEVLRVFFSPLGL
jgi:hypothetical protein